MSAQHELLSKIGSNQALIGIVGMGYVGLPLALRFSEVGFPVLGLDIDPEKVSKLNDGLSYIKHIDGAEIRKAKQKGFYATTDFSDAKRADVLIICVPTPLNKYREPDLSFVINTTESLLPHLRKGQLVSLESTTYPGTTDEELLPRIEQCGFKVGENIFLVFSPEREDPGNPHFNTRTIPKVCGGVTEACLQAGVALYGKAIDKVVPVSSTRAAEMTKLLENIHRAVNIGLVNEMKIVADKMNIDIHEVIQAAATKPFGFTAYYPGPGLGGHCIPIDPFYLTWKAREYNINTRFIELAGEVNANMPQWVISKVSQALNERNKPLKDAKILMLGIAYKKNIDDMRESPSVQMMELLREQKAIVSYTDPYVPKFPKMREHKFDLVSEKISAESLRQYDCVIVGADHDDFDYEMIKKHANLVVDTRGRYRLPALNIVKA
ncbi:MAG: nucleotide sugar dehydrogenase [Bdellovibrionales bacterium]